MSVPADSMNSGFFSTLMNDPELMDAIGIMSASGPSRMPVGLGQALTQGLGQGMQLQQSAAQLGMTKLQMQQAQQRAKFIQSLLENGGATDVTPGGSQSQQPASAQPVSPDADVSAGVGGPLVDAEQNLPPSAPPQRTGLASAISPAAVPGMGGLLQDPNFRTGMAMDMLGVGGGTQLMDAASSWHKPMDIRQGGSLVDPYSGKVVYYSPKLDEGMVLNQDGTASYVPGYIPGTLGMKNATERLSNYNTPTTYVGPDGAQHVTSVGANLYGENGGLFGGLQLPMPGAAPASTGGAQPAGGGRVTALPPSVTEGMEITGKEATTRANEAVEKQQASQQQIGTLAELESSLNDLGAGPGKEQQLAVKNALASVGGFLGIKGIENADLTNAAVARKSIVNLVAPSVRAMGAREPYQMVNFIKDGMASINNPEAANSVVIGLFRGIAEYQNATGRYAGDWLKDNNGTGFTPQKGAWDANWQKQADPTAYIMENLPPFEQQAIMNAAKKNPALAAEIKRAQTSGQWLSDNGYIRGQQ